MPNVSLLDSNNKIERTFDGESGKIIFECAEASGIELPHGCLAGSCSACRVEIVEGVENLSPIGAIEKDTLQSLLKKKPHLQDKTIRLSCRAKIISGDVKIKLID